MVTAYLTVDRNNSMSRQIFAPVGPLARNRAVFEYNTRENAFIASEEAYETLLCRSPFPGHRTVVVPRRTKGQVIENGNLIVVTRFEAAIPAAGNGHHAITILGGSDLLHLILRKQEGIIDRILLVQVDAAFENGIPFSSEIIDNHFLPLYQEQWPVDAENPYAALFQVYRKK